MPKTSSSCAGKLGCDVVAEGAEPQQTKRRDTINSKHLPSSPAGEAQHLEP